jgi:hypothetical protein
MYRSEEEFMGRYKAGMAELDQPVKMMSRKEFYRRYPTGKMPSHFSWSREQGVQVYLDHKAARKRYAWEQGRGFRRRWTAIGILLWVAFGVVWGTVGLGPSLLMTIVFLGLAGVLELMSEL